MTNLNSIIEMTKNLKLLYVEDNEITIESTLLILEEFFDDITLSTNGLDALEEFKVKKFDLIITDLNMPKLDGIKMSQKIREINSAIPIIILSAHNEDEHFIHSIKIGMSAYLNKPLDIDKLISTLSNISTPKDETEQFFNTNTLEQYKYDIEPNSIITIIDFDGTVTYINNNFCKIVGYSKEDILGKPYHTLSKKSKDQLLIDEIWKELKIKKKSWYGTIRYENNFGKVYYLRGYIRPILDKNNNIIEYIAIREDITNNINQKIDKMTHGDFTDN